MQNKGMTFQKIKMAMCVLSVPSESPPFAGLGGIRELKPMPAIKSAHITNLLLCPHSYT